MKPVRTKWDYFILIIKGMMMGAADSVPGISGGTIAFITGIYEELIHSLKNCDWQAVNLLFKQGFIAAWKHINGNFLFLLVVGILLSVFTLANLVLYSLELYPKLLNSFFFGLILASVWIIFSHIEKWTVIVMGAFVLASCSSYILTLVIPVQIEVSSLAIFLSGMLAICAMILPGISGSFILLLLGMYAPILSAVKNFEIVTIVIFASGCLLGLLSFSHVLDWMFSRYRTVMLAFLGGFMLGSLNKVWPWKYIVSYIEHKGKLVPLIEKRLLPFEFESITGQPSLWQYGIGLMLIGATIVILVDWYSRNSKV